MLAFDIYPIHWFGIFRIGLRAWKVNIAFVKVKTSEAITNNMTYVEDSNVYSEGHDDRSWTWLWWLNIVRLFPGVCTGPPMLSLVSYFHNHWPSLVEKVVQTRLKSPGEFDNQLSLISATALFI